MKKPCMLRGDLGNQSGIVLPLVLVFLLLGMLLLTPMLALATTSLSTGTLYEDKTREAHAADAGLELGIHSLIDSGGMAEGVAPIVLTDTINDCSVLVTVSHTGEYTADAVPAPIYHIVSFAQRMGTDAGTTVDAYVSGISFNTMSAAEFSSIKPTKGVRLVVEDGIVEGDLSKINSNYLVKSVLVFTGSVPTVTGDVTVEGTLIFTQPVYSFQGSAGSSGSIAFCNQVDDEGQDVVLEYKGGVESTGVLFVNGDLHFGSSVSDLEGTVVVLGNITSQTGVTISGDLCCTGNVAANVDYDPDRFTDECAGYYDAYCLLNTADFKTISYVVE